MPLRLHSDIWDISSKYNISSENILQKKERRDEKKNVLAFCDITVISKNKAVKFLKTKADIEVIPE